MQLRKAKAAAGQRSHTRSCAIRERHVGHRALGVRKRCQAHLGKGQGESRKASRPHLKDEAQGRMSTPFCHSGMVWRGSMALIPPRRQNMGCSHQK